MTVRLSRALTTALLFGATMSCGSDSLGPPAFRLRFSAQPAAVVAGVAQAVQVELLGDDGARLTSSRDAVTLTVETGADATGEWTVRASGGVATFADVVITEVRESHTLQATSRGLIVVSLPFAILPAGPNADESSFTVTGSELVSNTPYPVVFTFRDVFANSVANATVSLSSPTAGVTFTPATGVTNGDGQFTSTLRGPPGSVRIRATVAGTSIDLPPELSIADACTPAPFAVPGTASGTLTQGTGCIVSARPTAIREFSISTVGGMTLDVRPTFDATFEIRRDPERETITFISDDSSNVEWVLPVATYRLLVGASSGSGQYTLTATTGPGNTGDNAKVLVAGGTYTGQSLTNADLFDGIWYTDLFFFADPRPCTITLNSTAFDAFLIIANAITGDPVSVDNNSGGGTDARVVRTSCRSVGQPIVINVTSVFEREVGPYTLTVTIDAEDAIEAGPAPSSVPLRLTRPAELQLLLRKAALARTR
jgi:hypothetical protein